MNVSIKINPCKDEKLASIDGGRIYEACGLIPKFLAMALETQPTNMQQLADAIDKIYQYGGFKDGAPKGIKITSEGKFTYLDDPDLLPYVKFEIKGVEAEPLSMYIYPHAWVALVSSSNTLICRMD